MAGPVGNIPIPEFLRDFLAPVDFQEVTSRDLGEMLEVSPEGLVMARALVRDGVLRQRAEGGGSYGAQWLPLPHPQERGEGFHDCAFGARE